MYGKVVSSQGNIVLANNELEKLINFEEPVEFLSINLSGADGCYLYINDDKTSIYLPIYMAHPFEINHPGLSISSFKLVRNDKDAPIEKRSPFSFSYYGYY